MEEKKRLGRPPKKKIEPLEEQIGQDGVSEFKEDLSGSMLIGAEEPELVKPRPDSMESLAMKDKLANLEFMEDMVTIHIHDTAEKNADQIFEVAVNGSKRQVFVRGQQYTVKRYIVEGLARAKPVHYDNEEYEENGIKGTRYPSRTGLRYGFSVIHDPHPRGVDWLRAVLKEP